MLGPIVAGAAAFLLPQRNDIGSAIVLVAVFTAGVALAAPSVRRPRPAVVGVALVALLALRFGDARTALLLAAVVAVGVAAVGARVRRIPLPSSHRWRTAAGSAFGHAAQSPTTRLAIPARPGSRACLRP